MAKEMFDKSNLNAGATDELNKLPDGGPFAVINLLYKDWAEYPPGKMTEKLTGRQAYERYSELSVPFVKGWRSSVVARHSCRKSDRP